jgi:CRP-like cAMP-binding protein
MLRPIASEFSHSCESAPPPTQLERPMSLLKRSAPGNSLLARLPERNRQRVLASCERVELEFGQALSAPGDRLRHVYFPLDSFISLVTALDDGARLEVGIVGSEGMFGTSLVLGIDISPQHALVQGAGTALRLSKAAFLRQCSQSVALQKAVYRYVHVLMSQLAQTAACSHYHLIESRLARWLLLTRDRARSNRFRLTHEFLAFMLGVRRVGITEAASALQKRGLIDYRRGRIAILDGTGLEKASCRCYAQSNEMYDQAMEARRPT